MQPSKEREIYFVHDVGPLAKMLLECFLAGPLYEYKTIKTIQHSYQFQSCARLRSILIILPPDLIAVTNF